MKNWLRRVFPGPCHAISRGEMMTVCDRKKGHTGHHYNSWGDVWWR